MLRFLFWNLNRKPIAPLVAKIAELHDVDVVLLAEMTGDPGLLAFELTKRSRSRPYHHTKPNLCDKVHFFARFSPALIRPVYDTQRMTIRQLMLPGRETILIAGVHLSSKLHTRDDAQGARCVQLANDLTEQENRVGHSRTIIAGDFNMNPFEFGLAGAPGFNAAMTPALARRATRRVESRPHRYFYNPMWNHFGDRGPNPPGTYFHESSTLRWNMFDQVLVRPDLISKFMDSELKILTAIGPDLLLKSSGIPDADLASDHLPLLFGLDV